MQIKMTTIWHTSAYIAERFSHHHGVDAGKISLKIMFLDKCPFSGPKTVYSLSNGDTILKFSEKSPSFGQFLCFMDLKHENPPSVIGYNGCNPKSGFIAVKSE